MTPNFLDLNRNIITEIGLCCNENIRPILSIDCLLFVPMFFVLDSMAAYIVFLNLRFFFVCFENNFIFLQISPVWLATYNTILEYFWVDFDRNCNGGDASYISCRLKSPVVIMHCKMVVTSHSHCIIKTVRFFSHCIIKTVGFFLYFVLTFQLFE